MKGKWVKCALLVLVVAAMRLPAQQGEADRKRFEVTKAKAEKGDAIAQVDTGFAYLDGSGVLKDETEAVKWWRKAAEQNVVEAQYNLGGCYLSGRGVAKDEVMAVKWYRKAAEQHDPRGETYLGYCYETGQGVAQDYVEAVKWYRKAADHNHAEAQGLLGFCYAKGTGVAKDDEEAVKWYRKAAEQGLASAQFNLGTCYHSGKGVVKDYAEEVRWIRKAAEQNDAHAQTCLGACYAEGEGVVKDSLEAVKWYRKAAEQNNARAQAFLGDCYITGQGVTKDEVEAVKWYRTAAEQDYAHAQTLVGDCYHAGLGVTRDEAEAVKWYRRAADQGNWFAQYQLGIACSTGQGLAKDYVEGYKWLLLAAVRIESIKKDVATVEGLMSREQVAEGQKLAKGFRPRKESASDAEQKSVPEPFERSNAPRASGTGFFITEDGFLITNAHVVRDSTQARLLTSAGLIRVRVLKVDSANDLALLKAEGRFATLSVASSRAVKLGGMVATVGFPNIGLQGFAPKLAKGEIASLSGAGDDARYFQISVPVQPGNSGGALVDERGNVVGIVSAKLNAAAALAASGELPENVNYAVKSSFLLGFLESVPEVSAKLKEPNTKERKFEDVVKSAEQAAVLVLVY